MDGLEELRLREAMYVIVSQTSSILNYSEFCRQLCISHASAEHRVRVMAQLGWIRLLPALPTENKTMRRPRVTIRDPQLACRILGIRWQEQLMQTPLGRRLAAGAAIEEIIKKERQISGRTRFYYYGRHGSVPLDLVVDSASFRLGVYCSNAMIKLEHHTPLKRAIHDNVITHGILLTTEFRAYHLGLHAYAAPYNPFTARYEDWRRALQKGKQIDLMLRWVSQ